MAGLDALADLASVVSAYVAVANLARDQGGGAAAQTAPRPYQSLRREYAALYRRDGLPSGLEDYFSSYSDSEIRALTKRLEACRSKFAKEGDGKARRKCICSVLRDASDGNNGFPSKEWESLWQHMGC